MKNIFKIIALPALAVTVMAGCKKSFDSLNANPNKPTSVPAALLFNGVVNDMYDNPAAYDRPNQYFLCNYDYYGNNRYDFGSGDNYYGTLTNVIKMEENAASVGLPAGNAYEAMGKFFRAYFFSKMSLEMGDIPVSQALLGAQNFKPAYDAQKDVFKQCLLWLDTANTQLGALAAAGDQTLQGDIYYGNSVAKWQKAVNAFHLRLLIELSKRADDGGLDIKDQFKAIVTNPAKFPLMESEDDNLQYNYIHPTNDYPNSPDNFGFDALRYNTSATYVGLATQLKDPRVFITAEPATALVAAGKTPTSFDAFLGADPGQDLGIMYVKANNGDYSLLNRWHYYQTYTGEPGVQIGYHEQCFMIAEGINRGWATGDAESWYKKGIIASMSFYGIPMNGDLTLHFLAAGSPGSSNAVYTTPTINFKFDDYYAQPLVKYAGDNATGLKQILQQKYIAYYRQSGLEPYYQFRRTGTPTFTTGPGTGNSGRVALRFQYPGSEKSANTDNYEAALQAQYGGNDDINGVMWLLK